MTFTDFIQWAFLGVLTGGVYVLYLMKVTMDEMNLKLAVLITEHQQTKSDVEDHEERLRTLESEI